MRGKVHRSVLTIGLIIRTGNVREMRDLVDDGSRLRVGAQLRRLWSRPKQVTKVDLVRAAQKNVGVGRRILAAAIEGNILLARSTKKLSKN